MNGLRDASRLFHEHVAAVLTSLLGFTRREALPTLFVDLARNVFIAVHVDDLIMVGSSSQLSEVVGEMKQYFTMKVTHPLSASYTQTYVCARYLRHGDAIWELPTARHMTGVLNEHSMQNAKLLVTPAVNRNDDDDESEEASAEEHRSLRRIVGKSQFLAPRRPDIAFAANRLARSLACPSKSDIIASKRLLRYLRGTQDFGLKLQVQNRACSTLTVFTDSDWAGDRPTRKSVSSWVIMLDGFLISSGGRTQSEIAQSSCEAEYIAATAATSEAKYIQSLFLACGRHVNIHLRSDSSGAIGKASRRGLQLLRHLGFCGCRRRPPARTFESARCLVLRTWLTLTRNLQTNVLSSSADQRWASRRSRNSSVMQFCNNLPASLRCVRWRASTETRAKHLVRTTNTTTTPRRLFFLSWAPVLSSQSCPDLCGRHGW